MEPWQEQVLKEAEDFETRLTKLRAFLAGIPETALVSDAQRRLLAEQVQTMTVYLAVLKKRIQLFE